jgi:hypothetical protein
MLDKKQGSYECVPEVAGDLESIEMPKAVVVPPEHTMKSSPTTAKQIPACDLAGIPIPAPIPWIRQLYWMQAIVQPFNFLSLLKRKMLR